jgi:hypothetical protein
MKTDSHLGSYSHLANTKTLAAAVAILCGHLALSHAQGTFTINFEGPPYTGGPAPQPPGTFTTISSYRESGMVFWDPYAPNNLALIGAGWSGAPNDGTAHLDVTGGAYLGFDFTAGIHFNLVSFDAAGEDISLPGASLTLVGYGDMGLRVTNYFVVDSLANRRAASLPTSRPFTWTPNSRTSTEWTF